MIERKPTNDCTVCVTPRDAGDFGSIRISGRERSPEEEKSECGQIEKEIKRHIDGVGRTWIQQEHKFVVDESEFDTLYQALEHKYSPEAVFEAEYRHHHYNQEYGTRGVVHSFEELILEANENPWKFEVASSSPVLSEIQTKFLLNLLSDRISEIKTKIESSKLISK